MVNTTLYKATFGLLMSMFVFFSAWWVFLLFDGGSGRLFSSSYGLVALAAGMYGLYAARNWGYFKSYFGKAIILLSFGLLLQEFGQLSFSYMDFIAKIAIPYPSIPDIGFFGSIPLYILGAYYLSKGLGVGRIVKKSPIKLILGIAAPLVILSVSYLFFLKDYDPSQKDLWTIVFDFGYPLGQAVYVSIALIIVLSLGALLGGTMRWPIMALLLAFITQYIADFNFLLQTHYGTWKAAEYGDYLYLLAYFVMGASLIYLNRALSKGFMKATSIKAD